MKHQSTGPAFWNNHAKVYFKAAALISYQSTCPAWATSDHRTAPLGFSLVRRHRVVHSLQTRGACIILIVSWFKPSGSERSQPLTPRSPTAWFIKLKQFAHFCIQASSHRKPEYADCTLAGVRASVMDYSPCQNKFANTQFLRMSKSKNTCEPHCVDRCVHQGISFVCMESIADVNGLAIDVHDVDNALPVAASRPLPGVRNIGRLWVGDRIKHPPSLRGGHDDDKTIYSSESTLCGVVTRIRQDQGQEGKAS